MTKAVSGASEVTPKSKKDYGELESIRIEKASNGFTVFCSHKPKPSKSKDGGLIGYVEPEKYVFSGKDAASDTAEFVEMALTGDDEGDD